MTGLALIYCRQSLSNPDDAGDSISVAFQERQAREYAGREGLTVETVFSDVDVRGHVRNRPGLNALLDRIRRGGIACLVCFDLSRIAREAGLFVAILDELDRHGVRLASIREPGEERWLKILFGAFAERDKHLLSERVSAAMRERARLGQFVGSVPIGYDRVACQDAGGRIVRRLQPTHVATIVRETFERYDRGESISTIARWLNEPGQPAPHRAERWSVPSVAWLLRNPAYAGDVVVKGSAKSGPIYVRSAHPAIVDRDVWERVQRRLNAVGRREIPRARKPLRHWLEGRVFCVCGAPMYLFVKRHVSDGHELKTWVCRRSNAANNLTGTAGECPESRSVVGNRRVEPVVLRTFARDLATMAAGLPDAPDMLADREDTGRGDVAARLDEVRKRRRNNARAVETAEDPSFFVATDNRLAAEEKALTAQLAATAPIVTAERVAWAQAFAADAAGLVERTAAMGDQQGLRDLAHAVGLRVVVTGESWRVRVSYDEVFGRLLASR